jgi:hypothetical protein
VSSGPFQATITKGCERWHLRYDVGYGSFPFDVGLVEKFLVKEINLLAHRLVDIKLKLGMINLPGRLLYHMIYVLDLVLGRAGEIAHFEGKTYAAELGGTVYEKLLVLGQRICDGCI